LGHHAAQTLDMLVRAPEKTMASSANMRMRPGQAVDYVALNDLALEHCGVVYPDTRKYALDRDFRYPCRCGFRCDGLALISP